MKPKISLIIPVYGVEKYIEKFATSVFEQSYQNVQYIFVNDGTKDNSIHILEELIEKKFNHLRDKIQIIHKENGGLPSARKEGIKYVEGDYVYHLDPDDWLAPDSFTKIVQKADETDADVIYFDYVKEYEKRRSFKKAKNYTDIKKYISDMYNHKVSGSFCMKCIKSDIYKNNEIFFPKYSYAEDIYTTSQLVGYSKSIAYLEEYIYHYRKTNPTSITRQNRKKRHKEYALNFLDLYEKYRNKYQDKCAYLNPIAPIVDDILIQAGWYSILYGFDLFSSHSYLSQAIRKARIRPGTNVPLLGQLLVKLIAWFK